jgi:hypothetical protein
MEFICTSPQCLPHITPWGLNVLHSERHVKLSPIILRGRSPVIATQVSRQAGENYPTPAQIFEEIGCHLAFWLTLALMANLLLRTTGV